MFVWYVHACPVTQSRLTLCDQMDCIPTGSSIHGTFQARALQPLASPALAGRLILYCCVTCEARYIVYLSPLFQIYLNLYFQVDSCRQHAVGSHFYVFSDNHCLLTGVFGTTAFKTITDRVGLKICYLAVIFFLLLAFWLSRFLRYITLWCYRCWACKFFVVCESSFVCLTALF